MLRYKIKPIIHSGKLISIRVKSTPLSVLNKKRDGYNFTLNDSNLLLLQSLDKLAKYFNIGRRKGIFPYFLKDISYKGDYPKYEYFNTSKVSMEEYESNRKSFKGIWSFKAEAIKYCMNDSMILFLVVQKFNDFIFDNFKININKYPTIPSLAFAIYRSKYMPILTIPMISGEIKKQIQLGYTGGSTDMFIPSLNVLSQTDKKIYAYDVNSLYPFVMSKFDMPTGNPTYLEFIIPRDLRENLDLFGHFYCKVIAPENLLHPILQLHHKTHNGIRTVAPLGKFEGWFFSEEVKNALNFGYEVEIVKGYIFERKIIFKKFVEDMYKLRTDHPKTHPINYIAKIIMNSLYGRFGMDDNFNKIVIIPKEDFDNYPLAKGDVEIEEVLEFDKHLLLKIINKEVSKDITPGDHNINISIAAAVTAYARIHMSQFKNNPNLPNLYYSDTDSLYFDAPLPKKLVDDTKLGFLKLEGIWDKALFLAPKVYALKNNNEEIIKIKGLTKEAIKNNNISIDALELLLSKDHELAFNQKKWFKNITAANIQILNQTYTLKATDNKRELIYCDRDILVATKPLILIPPPLQH